MGKDGGGAQEGRYHDDDYYKRQNSHLHSENRELVKRLKKIIEISKHIPESKLIRLIAEGKLTL